MDARSILLSMLPVGLTLINYAIICDLLWGILLGSKSKKSALRHKGEASGWERFTQSYMTPLISKYQKEYKTWKTIKLLSFLFAIAQVIAFTVMIILGVRFWIIAIICGVITVLNIVLFSIMMTKTAASDNKHDRKGTPWKFEQ
ncbi:MAG: hypothetical protein IKQ91_03130 [Oscillospiraceae bacterium]|nr:hypothetical protein [Oscillospiraceae bacterium]